MKTIQLFTLLIITSLISSCEFNKSINKDLTSGAFSKGDGISCDEIKIEINEKVQKRNKFVFGEKVNFVFENISGLKKVNGKVFPGLSMIIIKNGKDTVVIEKDMLADVSDGTDLYPLQLQAHFVTNLTYDNNEKYKVYIKIWDKKGKGTFDYELPFTVERNRLLTINKRQIEHGKIYLWDDTKKQVVVDNEIDIENTFILIIEGISGLEAVNNKVYPAFSIEIVDKEGNKILSNPSILEQYRKDGVESEGFDTRQLPVTISFTPGKIANPCRLKASLTDLKSDKRLDITGELIIK